MFNRPRVDLSLGPQRNCKSEYAVLAQELHYKRKNLLPSFIAAQEQSQRRQTCSTFHPGIRISNIMCNANHLAIFLVYFGFFFIGCIKGQVQNPALAKDGGEAVITFTLPDTVKDASNIFIKLDPEDGKTSSDKQSFRAVVQPGGSEIKIFAPFQPKLQGELDGMQVKLIINPVNISDSGFFRCYTEISGGDQVENCGRRLIVLRPPEAPTITPSPPDDSLLVGSRLRLTCQAYSTSLPVSHGLPLKVLWMDGQGQGIPTGSRFYVNSEQDLQVDQLSMGDKNLQFSCQAADDTGNTDTMVKSQPSTVYTVLPEYAPTPSDLRVTPPIEEGATISKKVGEVIEYKCEADCNPACEVKWMYKADTDGAKYGEIQNLRDPSVLLIDGLQRSDPGTYRCRAKNKHSLSPVRRTFHAELLYIERPTVYINNQLVSNESIWENVGAVEFKCEFDSNPRPDVKWLTPSGQTLPSTDSEGPKKRTNPESNIPEILYSSSLYLSSLTCEDAGVYSCRGKNDDIQVEGRMNLNVRCRPRPSVVPGERLQEEYAWEIPEPVKFEFVMRGWPAPKIKRISSSMNDEIRSEVIGQDMAINLTPSYRGQQWLTLVEVQSMRPLTQEDSGRRFIMEFFSSDYETVYEFKIRLRGPPHEVHNITLENVNHHSVEVFWQAGFDGGEEQTFSIELCKMGTDGGDVSSDCTVAVKDIAVMPRGLWQTAKLDGLQASTEYQGRIVASSVLGSTTTEFSLKTTGAPSGGLSAGAVVGIVFACLIFMILVACAVYWFVLRKRLGKGGKEFSIAGLRDTLKKLIKKDGEKPSQNGGVRSGSSQPKKNPIYRVKKMVKKIPQKLKKDYNTVQVRDVEDDDDYSPDEFDHDDDYMNTQDMLTPKPDEIVYANASAIRKNAEEKRKNEGRKKNDEGLIYVTLDHQNSGLTPFSENKTNNNNNRTGNNKDNTEPTVMFKPQEDSVEYSDIDFTKTPPKNGGIHQEVRAELNPTLDKDGDGVTVVAVPPDSDDAVSATDGGAEVEAEDGGAQSPVPSGAVVVPESKFGTAV